jgi:hypothetical protein
VNQLTVNPAVLDRARASLDLAKASIKTGFDAQTTEGKLPDKVSYGHGLTALSGSLTYWSVIDGSRKELHAHLEKVLEACNDILSRAKQTYLAMDDASAGVLNEQVIQRS